ncbi:hypothetical protein H2202_004590 [Exophiala xenobiotica]|nr:hypothetical protein H2202_004590 [Exophiala xenobiotica]
MAVKVHHDFEKIGDITQLHLNDGAYLVQQRFEPVVLAMSLDQITPGLNSSFTIDCPGDIVANSLDRAWAKLVPHRRVDDVKVEERHDMLSIPQHEKESKPAPGPFRIFPHVDFSNAEQESLPWCAGDGDPLDDTGEIFQVKWRRIKVVNDPSRLETLPLILDLSYPVMSIFDFINSFLTVLFFLD